MSKKSSIFAGVMKKILLFLFVSLYAMNSMAQVYCTNSAIGYGAAATGGGSATPTLVSTVNQLQNALSASGNKVIIITQNLTFNTCMKIQNVSNKTLMALPGVTLTSNQQDAVNSGILYFKSCSNIILRNLTFIGPGAYDCDGWDLLCFDGVTKAWVDHCDFQDGVDGNFDNKGKTDNVTVSWCRFRYLKAPRAGGPGGADDHRFTNLLGSSSSDKPADGTYNLTWAYCWWDNGCKQRMVRCRNASLHFLNCYWNSSVADYYIGPENADVYVEGCTISGNPSAQYVVNPFNNSTNGARFVNCSGTVPANISGRTVLVPTYAYNAVSASTAKLAVTDADCGAGATLLVTMNGDVSSSCGSDPQPEGEEYCYNLQSAPSLPSGMTITMNGAAPTYDATNGIVLSANTDYLCIDVSGWNKIITSATVNVMTGSKDASKGFVYGNDCEASFTGASVLNTEKTFTDYILPRLNTQVLTLRRQGTSTSVRSICLTLIDESATGVAETEDAALDVQKYIRDGRLYIRHHGVEYDMMGHNYDTKNILP